MTDNKSIDHLVSSYLEKEEALQILGYKIEESAHSVVVLFIDLADSTKMKSEVAAQRWLGYVYNFIEIASKHAEDSGGTIVKRIGDELLVTFVRVEQTELFLDNIKADQNFNKKYRYKIAVDYGIAYFFKFSDMMPDDPYGVTVDRCARIAKYAEAGTILCGSAYVNEVSSTTHYWSAGKYKFKGICEPEEIFIRNSDRLDNLSDYIKPLIDNMNDTKFQRNGYRYVSRQFNVDYYNYNNTDSYNAHPFLLRELLNVPKLPFSLQEFIIKLTKLENKDDKYDFIGSLVEWKGYFKSYSNQQNKYYMVNLNSHNDTLSEMVILQVPNHMLEVLKLFCKGTIIHFRGIITDINSLWITLDYVDIELP